MARPRVPVASAAQMEPDPASVRFQMLCAAVGLPRPVSEYKFHPTRRWRFDHAFVPEKIAVEQEGAVWVNGRHTRGSGFVKDIEKYNAAAALGWRVIRGTPAQIARGDVLATIQQAMETGQEGR